MILDNIRYYEKYCKLNDGFEKGFEFIKKAVKEDIPVGKYEIDGKKVYASIQEYDTKEVSKFEAHKNYIDIQFMVRGSEKMVYDDIEKGVTTVSYNPEKDVEFYGDIDGAREFVVNQSEFAIFFPEDCHKPGLKVENSEFIKKIVVKVRVEE